jgi:preprotein translocase subunit SecA
VKSNGKSIWRDIEKAISLAVIDDEWKEHLRSMDELKDSVQGASFEQKDPLVIYKVEAYNLFAEFIGKTNQEVTSYLSKGMLLVQEEEQKPVIRQAPQATRVPFRNQMTNQDIARRDEERRRVQEAAANAGREPQRPQTMVRSTPKVGPNDPCPCGSGKKYKKCHGAN